MRGKGSRLGEGGFDEWDRVKAGFHQMPFGGGLSLNVMGGILMFYGRFDERPPTKGMR